MEGIGQGIVGLFIFLLCFLPLGVWKAVELVIWFFKHIRLD
jgi:hypothetical protein